MIREELATYAEPIDAFITHPRNVREGNVQAIMESLRAHGQYRPIVVQRSTNHVLAGNHTLQAARLLGWQQIAVTYIDCDDEQGVRILLADNRTNDLASYNDDKLAELLKILQDTPTGFEGTLFDDAALLNLLRKTEPVPRQDSTHEIDHEAWDMAHKCPKCGFEYDND